MNSYSTHPWPEKGLKVHEDDPQFDREAVRSNGVTFYSRAGEAARFSPHEGPGALHPHFRSSRHKDPQSVSGSSIDHSHGSAVHSGSSRALPVENGFTDEINRAPALRSHHPPEHLDRSRTTKGNKYHSDDRGASHHGGQYGNHFDGADRRFGGQIRHDYHRGHEQRGHLSPGADDSRPQGSKHRQDGGRHRGYDSTFSSPLSSQLSWSPDDSSSPRPQQSPLPHGTSRPLPVSGSPQDPHLQERRFPPTDQWEQLNRFRSNRSPPMRDPQRIPPRKEPLLSSHPPPPLQRGYPSLHPSEEDQRRYRMDVALPYHSAERSCESSTRRDPRLLRNKATTQCPANQRLSLRGKSEVEMYWSVEQIKKEHCYSKPYLNGLHIPERNTHSNLESADQSQRVIVPRSFLTPIERHKTTGILRGSSASKSKPTLSEDSPSLPTPHAPAENESKSTPNPPIEQSGANDVDEKNLSSFCDSTFPAVASVSLDGFELDLDPEPDSSGDEEETMIVEGNEWEDDVTAREATKSDRLVVSLPKKEEPPTRTSTRWAVKSSEAGKVVLTKLPTSLFAKRPVTLDSINEGTLSISSFLKSVPPTSDEVQSIESPSDGSHPARRSKRLARIVEESSESEEEGEEERREGALTKSELEDLYREEEDEEGASLEGVSLGGKRYDLYNHFERIHSGSRKRDSRGRWIRHRSKRSRADHSEEQSRHYKRFNDFVPEILPTRSRTESATLLRRNEMEKEIEQHERERILTARPGDPERPASPLDTMCGDDFSSELSVSHLTSSSLERDSGSTKSTTQSLEGFSPDIVSQYKKMAARNFSGDTPLHKVCRSGKRELVRYILLVENAPVNVQDNAGWAPLHEACSSLHIDIVELLLQNGADVNISATDGTRPIHDAIERGSLDLVKLLVRHGADPQAEFGEKTPVEYAKFHDQMEIHDYLQSVVIERQKQRTRKSSPAAPTSQKRTLSLRGNKKHKVSRESSEDLVNVPTIPVTGYTQDDPKVCPELDFPLFYVTPVMELSDHPFLPVYNIEIVPGGKNPRRHNFYMLSDILETLGVDETELLAMLPLSSLFETTVHDFLRNLKHSYYNRCVPKPSMGMGNPKTKKVKLVPVCQALQELLNVTVENLDD